MRYGSVCSGIEAATVAWHGLGWTPAWFSEIAPFPSVVLSHRFPDVPNLGDMNTLHEREEFHDRPIDLLVGGTPCQSFSAAGLRKGLDDPRGNLALVFLRLAELARPRWIVWENVPGVLSSGGGRDFGAFLGALAELGYGWAYRILDAQFFGVPQRRRRVFVVGCLGDERRAGAVLLESADPGRNPATRRTKRSASAKETADGPWWDGSDVSQTLDAVLHKGQMMPEKNRFPVVFQQNQRSEVRLIDGTGLITGTVQSTPGRQKNYLLTPEPRRLTPRECERLQGFPDDWTLVPYRGRLAVDTPRYTAIGNSMAVPVMRWIGERLVFVDSLVDLP